MYEPGDRGSSAAGDVTTGRILVLASDLFRSQILWVCKPLIFRPFR